MIWRSLFIVLIFLPNGLCEFLLNDGQTIANFEDTSSKDSQIRKKVQLWLDNIKRSVPKSCGGPESNDFEPKNQLLRYVQCDEPDAIQTYSFSGKLDSQLKLSGIGILTISPDLPKMSLCITVQKLFGNTIETIQSDFVNGKPEVRALIGWSDVKVDVLLTNGMPQGVYRIEQGDRWAIGTLKEGKLIETCWIVNKNYILTGSCEDPWTLSKDSHSTIVFMHDLNVILVGEPQTNEIGKSVLHVKEMFPRETPNSTECKLEINGFKYGLLIELDLETLERNYHLVQNGFDQCTKAGPAANGQVAIGDENVSDAIKSYFTNLVKLSPDPSPVDTKKGKKFLNYLEESTTEDGQPRKDVYEAVITLIEKFPVEFNYFGKYDTNGRFHGQAVLKIDQQQVCYIGECKSHDIGHIFATFNHGVVQGLVVVTSPELDTTTCFIAVDGFVHSLMIKLGLKPLYPYVENLELALPNNYMKFHHNGVGFMAKFRHGKQSGPVWYGLIGEPFVAQGFLHGNLNKQGKLTGNDIGYLYPDYLTALFGKFEDKKMKSARLSKVSQVTCEDGLLMAKFKQPDEKYIPQYYDQSNSTSMGTMYLVKDPYEAMTVEVRNSTLEDAGHGIFAIRDIPINQVVAIYNGMVFDGKHIWENDQKCFAKMNFTLEGKKRCVKYKISGIYGNLYDIPMDHDDLNIYNATLAHKTNNNFHPHTNTFFGALEHPRFGLVVTVTASRYIRKGEEIFVDYGYSQTTDGTTDWYIQMKEKVFKEQEEKKKQENIQMQQK